MFILYYLYMKKNIKETLQNKFENYLKASKKKRKDRVLYQQKVNEELRKENSNLDSFGKFKKIFKFFLIIVLYNIFRILIRYKTNRPTIIVSDFVFSAIIIALYILYIINYKKNAEKKDIENKNKQKKK